MQFFLKEAQIMYVPIRKRIETLGCRKNYLLKKNGEGQNDPPLVIRVWEKGLVILGLNPKDLVL